MSPEALAALRAEFPALGQEIHGRPLAYLDNAASTHKPRAVIDALVRFYSADYSNVHRGVHTLSQRATDAYEAARRSIARFVGAGSADEIVFTRGTTEAINLVANAWGRANLRPGDTIVISGMEHHSNIVPWQLIAEATGAELVVMRLDATGSIADGEAERCIDARTRILSVVHTSNALGTVNPVRALADRAKSFGATVLVDGAQLVPHGPFDVRDFNCDFLAFSGHKMFGPTGIGALWGRPEVLAAMPPWQGGGDMIRSVSFEGSTWADPPSRFEAGTPAIAQAVGLGAAAEWMMGLDWAALRAHEAELLAYGEAVLAEVPGLRLIGTAPERRAVLGFVVEGCHPHDLGTLLDMEGVAVRVGHHCAEPIMKHFGVPATTRASVAIYNTRDELDRLAASIRKARSLLL